MRFDYSKLRGRIVEKYGTIDNFIKIIKRSKPFVYGVLGNKATLRQDDIVCWCDVLDIDLSEVGEFFLSVEFSKMD